jgi:hypothetical protein
MAYGGMAAVRQPKSTKLKGAPATESAIGHYHLVDLPSSSSYLYCLHYTMAPIHQKGPDLKRFMASFILFLGDVEYFHQDIDPSVIVSGHGIKLD